MRGWHVWNGSAVAAVSVEAAGVRSVVVPGNEPRPDVAESRQDPSLADSGWQAVLDLSTTTAAAPDIPAATGATVEVVIWVSPDQPAVRLPPIGVILNDEPGAAAPEFLSHQRRLRTALEGELVEPLLKLSATTAAADRHGQVEF